MTTMRLGKLGVLTLCGTLGTMAGWAGGCSSSSNNHPDGGTGGSGGAGGAGGSSGSLYAKYGGAPAVAKIVSDAVTGVLADCELSPYFAIVGKDGGDSAARLESCLRLQFTALMGGPATYPGVNDEGDTCVDMMTIHKDLGIPVSAFDKFITDLGAVLAANNVQPADITTIAGALSGMQTQIVSVNPVEKSACDGGIAGAGGHN